MATWYVNSAATGTGAGTSWTNACTTLAAAIALAAAGDTFNVAYTHSESTTSGTLTFPGTASSPNFVYSCDTTNSPAQASDLRAGASVATTGSNGITLNGGVYIYGVTFTSGSSTGNAPFYIASAGGMLLFDTCALVCGGSNSAGYFNIGDNAYNTASEVRLKNTTVKFSNAGQPIVMTSGRLYWTNTPSAIQGSTLPNNLFTQGSAGRMANVFCDGVDFTALSGKTLVGGTYYSPSIYQFVNCAIASTTTPAASQGGPGGPIVDFINSDSSATGYRAQRTTYEGTVTAQGSITLSGGASDGVEPISWEFGIQPNASFLHPLESWEIVQWFGGSGLGSSHTATFQVLGPSTATNANLWVEASYLGNSSYPLADLATSGLANPLATATALSGSGTGSWSSIPGGLQAFTISVSFTPQVAGYVRFVLKATAVLGNTFYVDPAPVIV